MTPITAEFVAAYVQSDMVIAYSQPRLNEMAALIRALEVVRVRAQFLLTSLPDYVPGSGDLTDAIDACQKLIGGKA